MWPEFLLAFPCEEVFANVFLLFLEIFWDGELEAIKGVMNKSSDITAFSSPQSDVPSLLPDSEHLSFMFTAVFSLSMTL